MNMASMYVVGLAPNSSAVAQVVGNLRLAGFGQRSIHAIRVQQGEEHKEEANQMDEGTEIVVGSALKGLAFGGMIGFIAGFGVLHIPGLQVLGPMILLTLFICTGGFVGTLSGAFPSETTSGQIMERYGMALRVGQTVISVTASDAQQAKRAEGVLNHSGTAHVNSYTEDITTAPWQLLV